MDHLLHLGFWKLLGLFYLALSGLLVLVVFVCLAVEDYKLLNDRLKYSMSKFGYNLLPNRRGGMRWGLGWWFLLGCMPVINLFVLVFFAFCRITNRRENRRMERE